MEDLIKLGHSLQDFVVGFEGNVSKRIRDDKFIIKSSGSSFKTFNTNSFVTCDMSGHQLDNFSKRPSIEVSFHSWIYNNSDYTFIAHTHPVNTLKILCSNVASEFSRSRIFPDQVVFNGKSYCLVPYALPGKPLTEEIKKVSSGYEKVPNIFLLKNHGIICCGKSMEEVALMTAMCEKSSEIFIGCKLLGGCESLSHSNIADIRNSEGENHRKGLV